MSVHKHTLAVHYFVILKLVYYTVFVMNEFLKYDAIPSTVKTSRFRCHLYRLVNIIEIRP